MRKVRFFLYLFLIFIPVKLLGTEIAVSLNPEYLLKQAIEEIQESREPKNASEYHFLLQLANDIARFDKSVSSGLFAEASKMARAAEEQLERLKRLEMLALYSAPIDKKISTDALLLIKIPGDYQDNLRIQLKAIAIEYVLTHRQNLPKKNEILKKVENFCREHETLYKSDIISDSSYAFADYVSLLEPELGKEVWTRLCPDRAWEKRLEIAEDLIHYAPQSALPELHSLLSSGPNKEAKIRVAVALYYAGEKEEARAAIARLKPEGAGQGRPLGELIARIARSDPEQATRIATAMGSETGVRSAMTIVLQCVAANRPKELPRFLEHMDNRYRRSTALRLAAESLAKKGELASAHKLADKITFGEQRCTALATIGEVSKNQPLINESLQLALKEDRYGRSLQAVTASAIRAFGVDEAKKMLLRAVPNLQTRWQDIRIFPVLLVVAEIDPAWALSVFKCGPAYEPRRNETVASHSVSKLLPKLAPVDPAFVEQYLTDHGKAEHPQTLSRLKNECVEEIAKDSVSEAKKFAERLDVPERTVDDRRLTFVYRTWQIVKSPRRVNQTVEDFKLHDPSDKRKLVLRAAETMIGWQEDYFRDVNGIIELTEALQDKSLADEVLSNAACLLFQLHENREAFDLLNRIQSNWQRAKALEFMARSQLVPRTRRRTSFLQGW